MYVRELHVRNIKLLRDFRLSFLRDGAPRMWTVLIGENGLCKTTILQAIALAASGPDRANQLADVRSLPDVRPKKSEAAAISAEFDFAGGMHEKRTYPGLTKHPSKPPRIQSELTIKPRWKVFDGTSHYTGVKNGKGDANPLREARAEGLQHWFTAGYGTGRIGPGPVADDPDKEQVLGRLDSLFDKGRLPGPEAFALPDELSSKYGQVLFHVLQHGKILPKAGLTGLGTLGVDTAQMRLTDPAFEFDVGHGSVILGLSSLSQGYRATAAWIVDLLGQLVSDAQAGVNPALAEGLVLIDEIDLYLHPTWQVALIPLLKECFPRMQFVVTTHSPMVLPGLERDEIVILDFDDKGNVVAKEPPQSPALMTGTQIYDTFFGLHSLYPNDLGEKLHRYGFLVGSPSRSDAEEAEMLGLRDTLKNRGVDPGWTPVPRGAALEDDDEVIP